MPIWHLLLRLGEMSRAQRHIWQLPGHEQLSWVLVPPLEERLRASSGQASLQELQQGAPSRQVDSALVDLSSSGSVVHSALPQLLFQADSLPDHHSEPGWSPARQWELVGAPDSPLGHL